LKPKPRSLCRLPLATIKMHPVQVRRTLLALKRRFDEVFFTVGNHELWMTSEDHG